MLFKVAPLDQYAERITIGVAYVGGLLMLPLLFALLSNLRWSGLLIPTTVALFLAIFLLLAYAFQPIFYQINNEELIVQRRWTRALKISLTQITGVSAAPMLANMPRSGVRFAFNPGIFGYQGPFRLEPYGRVFLLATDRERLVAIARQATVPLILSPEQPRQFMEVLYQQIQVRME